MNALESKQCEDATIILSQLDNEFERCFTIKPERREMIRKKCWKSLVRLSGAVRGMIFKP